MVTRCSQTNPPIFDVLNTTSYFLEALALVPQIYAWHSAKAGDDDDDDDDDDDEFNEASGQVSAIATPPMFSLLEVHGR